MLDGHDAGVIGTPDEQQPAVGVMALVDVREIVRRGLRLGVDGMDGGGGHDGTRGDDERGDGLAAGELGYDVEEPGHFYQPGYRRSERCAGRQGWVRRALPAGPGIVPE